MKNITPEILEKNETQKSITATLISIGMFLALLLALLWPLAAMWALNTLFKFAIEYTFWNWLACWILIFTFQGAINVSRKSKT